MIRRIGYPLALLALFAIAGGHWAVLQSVAWAEMIVSYSQEAGLHEAVAATFDGAHPCALCEKVAQGKRQEDRRDQASASLKAEKKAETLVRQASDSPLPPAAAPFRWAVAAAASAPARSEAPSVPPPRFLPA